MMLEWLAYILRKNVAVQQGVCYHILGVKLSLDAQETGSSKEKTLHSFETNTLSKKDKKSGRKQPRANDIRDEHKTGISPIQVDLSCRTL